MGKMKIDSLGISKIRWPKSVDFWSGPHKIVHSGASEKIPGTRGVRIIMNKTLGKKVKGYIQYDDRIILVKFQTKPKNTILVHVYMSTTNSNDEAFEEVYATIDKIIENVKEEENLVVMGDWNAIAGEAKVNNVTALWVGKAK